MKDLKTAIARHRFPFPNSDKPAWRTFVNNGGKPETGVPVGEDTVYPDILVIDRATTTNRYIMAAMVYDRVVDAKDVADWERIFPGVDFLYLFLPEGQCHAAAALAAEKNVPITGFRCYRNKANELVVTDCF